MSNVDLSNLTTGDQIVRQAGLTPSLTAVVDRKRRVSYEDFAEDVEKAAAVFRYCGVAQEAHVGVLLPREYELVVSLVGILRAGGVYVPLNPDLPDERLLHLGQDTTPRIIVYGGNDKARARRLSPTATLVSTRELQEAANRVPTGLHHPRAAAYVIQTSGSTGRPKSVQVEMRTLQNTLGWCANACRIDRGDRVLQVIASSFDASIRTFLTPLCVGATLVLHAEGHYDPSKLLADLRDEEITVFNPSVPSMFMPVLELAAKDGFLSLRTLHTLALGAEVFEAAQLQPWIEAAEEPVRILNVYGPTEAGDITCYANLELAQ